MSDPAEKYILSIRIAGNTAWPSITAIRAKGYELSMAHSKQHGEYVTDYLAVKEGRRFSATSAEEVLGLISMWEVRGDDWRLLTEPEREFVKRLMDDAPCFDEDGEIEP